jgi:hypothetical protein
MPLFVKVLFIEEGIVYCGFLFLLGHFINFVETTFFDDTLCGGSSYCGCHLTPYYVVANCIVAIGGIGVGH